MQGGAVAIGGLALANLLRHEALAAVAAQALRKNAA